MTSLHGLFENLDCSRKLLLLLLIWSEKSWLLKGRLAWWQGIKSTGINKRPSAKEGKANKGVPHFLVQKIISCGGFTTILLTPLLNLWNWGVDDSLFWGAMILKSWCDARACDDMMHKSTRYGAYDAS
jgi:hypothetical protein